MIKLLGIIFIKFALAFYLLGLDWWVLAFLVWFSSAVNILMFYQINEFNKLSFGKGAIIASFPLTILAGFGILNLMFKK